MKILYLITGLGLGGAERVVVDLSDQMNLLGHNVKIAYLTGEIQVKPASSDVEIIALHLNSAKDFLLASKKYQKLVKSFRPDVVHAHMVHANMFARLNRAFCPVSKLICTAHSSNEGGRARMLAYRLTNRLSNLNTNVSETAVNALIDRGAFSRKNLINVYNGIDLSRFEKKSDFIALNQNFINILAVGRFSDAKDYPNLISAFALLRKNNNRGIKLSIVGDGELRPQIESLIKELGLDRDITLLGRRSDIPQLLNQADIFVLASKFEGFGLVVAEAMACECYVVSTDSGGVAEVMGNTGQLVPIQDSQALADALQNAVNLSDEDRVDNNKKARARVEELFSLKTSVQKWSALYEAE
ncbi:glycosyltransferase [Psychrobacter sp. DAB_AL43B]|uniref:glycosyltransferase n=1 Tax=Psychrobacter sp. DAB_AL43B TaxID=1028416 RepID=UPI0009A7F6AA|nr:glycosyltransferase [Psychrobacter sp. DAB_AL43B]SLJ83941.1 glycosyltransferase [Psychrobacter sp. DAB_AL43B]